jgi:hypothetical protein
MRVMREDNVPEPPLGGRGHISMNEIHSIDVYKDEPGQECKILYNKKL